MIEWAKKGLSDDVGNMDEARVSAMVTVLTFLGCAIASVVMSETHEFKMQDFGIGFGAMAAGIGGWLGFRGKN
jgi:FtsH-binding integral membrane protein